jgi:sorbitol/mannitol transport system permease protein
MTATVDMAEPRRVPADDVPAAPKRRSVAGPLLGLVAWVVGLLFVAPVLWMVRTSSAAPPAPARGRR